MKDNQRTADAIMELIRNGARIVKAPAVLPDGSPYPEMPKEIGSISAKHEGKWKLQGVAKLLPADKLEWIEINVTVG